MKRKFLSVFALILVFAMIFAGCKETVPAAVSSETSDGAPTEEIVKVGVIQFVQHDALDSAYKGFVDGLAEAGYVEGENIVIDFQNAQGEIANTNTIASKLVNDNSDIILAIATPAAQAVANATTEIPVVITAVTDPKDAGLVESNEAPGRNITGTSDMTPVKEQIGLLVKFVPEAKVVGVIYSSNESNSEIQANIAKKAIEDLGLEYKAYTVSESNQIQQVVQSAVGEVDAFYAPTDNMIASAMVQISAIATENGVPVIGGEEGQVDNGALASYGVNYYELGKMTGAQAARIIQGEKPAEMPIEYQQTHALKVNEEVLKALGLTMPENLEG